ncbi:hypothetical protein BD770DRAFT_194651 [Pilaira anomala]|nr:hypothetical protein BD770DRAFT_194651 [Pilaira anomala]
MLNNDSNNNITTTFDNNQTLTRQRRNKFLSLFPSSKLENNDILKNKWKPTDITTYLNNNQAQQVVCPTSNKSVNTSPTMTSSSSSSSTVCPSPIPTLTKPFFKITNSCKPDYTMLQKYFTKFQNKLKHRSDILKLQLLPWLKKNTFNLRIQSPAEGDTCEENTLWGLKPPTKEKKELQFGRSVLLKWWRILLSSMLLIENEARSVYYESILEIISRCEFLDFDYVGPFEYTQWCSFSHDSRNNAISEYRQLLTVTLKYAFDRLNQRAIFSNMISFCSKILALCYFKIPGLASSLLEVLKLQPATMKKLKAEMTSKPLLLPLQYQQNLQIIFPPYLHQLMTPDMISYKHYFASLTKQRTRSPVNSSGNWVRR